MIGLVAPDLVPGTPPSLEVHCASYDVIGAPPLLAGGVKATVIVPGAGVTPVTVGLPGGTAGWSTTVAP